MSKIPEKIEPYEEGSVQDQTKHEQLTYEVADGETVEVVLWVRYPDYDFMFGVPTKDNPKYDKEVGFFCFRKSEKRGGGGWQIYIDRRELECMVDGFGAILERSKHQRPEVWQ